MNESLSLRKPKCILFDLDGTLADSAPDLAAAINFVRNERGLPAVPYEQLRPVASAGAPGLVNAAFHLTPENEQYHSIRERFLFNYATNIANKTSLFPGIPELLEQLRHLKIGWGIVTNKASRLTLPLIEKIGLNDADCIISGDTAPRPKPYPDPLLEATKRLGVRPEECWFVGDDLRDIQAGKAAGTGTIAAQWGYCTRPHDWNADYIAENPGHILRLVRSVSAK